MKRLYSNKGGEASYGPKWQNFESSSDSEDDDEGLLPPTITTAPEDNEDQIPKGKRVEVTVKDGELMYVAALQGDWVAAEVLLDLDRNLAFDYITEDGDRALHVAVAMKRKEFVEKLVGRMSKEELVLLDGHGYSACCYAAMSGTIEIARVMLDKNLSVATARDEDNATPLRKAALHGNAKMFKFLLGYTIDEDLSREEWFDLLLVAIRGNMNGGAMDIMEKNRSIATMANEEGTALHLMARVGALQIFGSEFGRLVEKLWDEMLKMEKASLLALIRKPDHVIHEAAKAGQAKMITMLTRKCPQLIWDTDSNGYTMFHLAVMYRQTSVFNLVRQVKAMPGLKTTWQDRQGNNILHLAAAISAAFTQTKLPPANQIRRELKWFQAVREIVPPSCLMMRNRKGLTPEELFSKTHKRLLKESEMWMMNRADSLMLIATIVLTVVFAAAFAVPGGYASQSGEPVLAKKKLFKNFVGYEVVGMMSSVASIIMFQSIMASSFAHREFLLKLPLLQLMGFLFLLLSLLWAYLAFMASIMLYNIYTISWLLWFCFASLCVYSSAWITQEFTEMFGDTFEIISRSKESLFEKNTLATASNG